MIYKKITMLRRQAKKIKRLKCFQRRQIELSSTQPICAKFEAGRICERESK